MFAKDKIKIESMLYTCQLGMYFSNIEQLDNGFIVYSNTVESPSWNFFTGFCAKTIQEFKSCTSKAIDFFASINRKFVLVLGPSVKISKVVKQYIQDNFINFENNVVLFTKKFVINKPILTDYTFRKIENKKERDFFVDVFRTSKLQTGHNDVYPPLPEYFFKALYNSFDYNGDWLFNHFVSEYQNAPIGMVTACIKGKYCGLYGGGTFLKHRGKGVFTNLLNYVQTYSKQIGCKYFFGITEKDSYNEKLYNSINWKSLMDLKYYEPK